MPRKILCLFDVDGTLTKPRNSISPKLENFLHTKLKSVCTLGKTVNNQQLKGYQGIFTGIVGGSDLKKIAEQMNGDEVIHKYDYVFSENGLVSFKNGREAGIYYII